MKLAKKSKKPSLSRTEKKELAFYTVDSLKDLGKTAITAIGTACSGNPVATIILVGGIAGLVAWFKLKTDSGFQPPGGIPRSATVADLTLDQINKLRILAGA